MALGRRIRRGVLTLAVIGAAGVAIVDPGIVKAFYQDIYPSDPAKRQALELCFMQDHKFNRLEASERERCYHRMLQPLGEISSSDPAVANLVDLQRAAGQGSVPRNDIRRLEQNENPPHAPH